MGGEHCCSLPTSYAPVFGGLSWFIICVALCNHHRLIVVIQGVVLEFLEFVKEFKAVLGDGYLPYLSIYLLYRFLFRPLRDELSSYLELRMRQASALDKLVTALQSIERILERVLSTPG